MTAGQNARLSQRRRSTLVANRRKSMFAEEPATKTICKSGREELTNTPCLETKTVKALGILRADYQRYMMIMNLILCGLILTCGLCQVLVADDILGLVSVVAAVLGAIFIIVMNRWQSIRKLIFNSKY